MFGEKARKIGRDANIHEKNKKRDANYDGCSKNETQNLDLNVQLLSKNAVIILFLINRDTDIILFYRPALHQMSAPLIPPLQPKRVRHKSSF